jgi:hypothetical protein
MLNHCKCISIQNEEDVLTKSLGGSLQAAIITLLQGPPPTSVL